MAGRPCKASPIPARLTTSRSIRPMSPASRDSAVRAPCWSSWACPTPRSATLHYAERKQRRLEELIRARAFTAFPDALRFVQAVEALRFRHAVASSSKNANEMMQLIRVDAGRTLLDVFAANVCGRDLRRRESRIRRACLPQRIWAWRPPCASWWRTRRPGSKAWLKPAEWLHSGSPG